MHPVLRRGNIIVCHGQHSLVSWLIQKIERSRWSHVAWVIDGERAIEALGGGVTITPLRKFRWLSPGRYKVVRIKPEFVGEPALERAVARAEAQVGRPYDWLLIFKLAWAWATKRRHDDPQEGSRRAWICSELVAEPLWEDSGFLFRDDIPAANTAPKDIAISDKVEQVWP
jgi:uncharacterized protein YycO